MTFPLASSLSRRAVVLHGSFGGAAALLAVRPLGRAAGQGASPVASPAALPPLLQSWVDAWNAADPKPIAAFYTPDAVYEDVPSNTTSKNGDVAGFLGGFMSAVADIHVVPRSAFATADAAALEYDFSATNKGFVPGAEAQGKSFSVRIATIFTLSGDKISRSS